MSQVIIAYHSSKDEDDKSCVDIFAQEKGCPPFWTRRLYGDESISGKDLAKDYESKILANPEQFLRSPETFFGKPKREQVKENKEEERPRKNKRRR